MNKTTQLDTPCPCGSGKTYGECCAPLINGSAQSKTAEALMRARYTSYAVGTKEAIDFIISTCDKSKDIPDIDRKATEDWSREST